MSETIQGVECPQCGNIYNENGGIYPSCPACFEAGVPSWPRPISISDRLPDDSDNYWCWCYDPVIPTWGWATGTYDVDEKIWSAILTNPNGWPAEIDNPEITHWLTIPPAPNNAPTNSHP